MTSTTWLYSCPWKLQRTTSHTIYTLNQKHILWKSNAYMDDLVLFEDLDETKIHTCFRPLAFTRAQLTTWKAWPKLRGAHPVLPTLAFSSAPWQCFPCCASPLFPAPRGGSSTPAFGKPLLWGTDFSLLELEKNCQGKGKCTPTTQTASASLRWPPAAPGLAL